MRRWQLVLAVRLFFVPVAVAALLCGLAALGGETPVLTGPTPTVFSPEFRAQVQRVTARLPADAPVLYLTAEHEGWFSRLWQRALYPEHQTIVIQPWDLYLLAKLRSRYGARFAISTGKTPADPGFLWKVDLGQVPGLPGVTWFGELKP